jgi:hypothetical protein
VLEFLLILDSDNNNQFIWNIRSASAGDSRVIIGTFSCDIDDHLSSGVLEFAESLRGLKCTIVRGFYTSKISIQNISSIFEGMNITWIPVSWIEQDSQLGIISYDLQ